MNRYHFQSNDYTVGNQGDNSSGRGEFFDQQQRFHHGYQAGADNSAGSFDSWHSGPTRGDSGHREHRGRGRGGGRGRGRGRGRGGGGGGGDGPSSDPNRQRHPPHLKGKDIGLWYARGGKAKKQNRDVGDRAVISLPQHAVNKLTDLLEDVKKPPDDEAGESSSEPIGRRGYQPKKIVQDTSLDGELYEDSVKGDHFEMYNSAYQKILMFRRQLPSFRMQDRILEMIENNQVSLISGETGCGKTTQVAQFILDDYIRRRCGSLCHIICTQPRRISAISVAERVAAERNEQIGKSCGYQIRLEQKLPRPTGSILYCTIGVLLRFLINDPNIVKASHIIIDEIHERDTLSDFLLIVINDLLPVRPDLKIILMSATLNAEIFSKYFDNCPQLEIPGSAYHVQDHYLEDFVGNLMYNPACSEQMKPKDQWRRRKTNRDDEEEYFRYLDSIVGDYSPYMIGTLRKMQFDKIDNNLVMAVLTHIVKNSEDGAILVFLPGWQDISNLHKSLNESHMFSNRGKFLTIPLHSRLPTMSQREVFDRPPLGCRKIVIATNIAETSITIDDVVFVVDCGKAREKNFNVEMNVASLDSEWISKASEKQRRGRAGRVQDGHCFHLFTKFHQSTFREYQLPEMLRTPLDSLCLQIKILKLGKMCPFLRKAIEPPSLALCELAIKELTQMRALDENENLTSLGHHLAVLPVSPKIGRMILFGAMLSCLDPVLTVAASLDSKDPFFAPLGKEKEADRKKEELADGSKSDHIALINAFNGWERAKVNHSERDYCWEHFLSMNHLRFIAGMKIQFAELLHNLKFMRSKDPKDKRNNRNIHNYKLIKAVICAGLYPNVAKVQYNLQGTRVQAIYTVGDPENTMKVGLHPKSVNSEEKDFESQWLIYHEKMKITKVYLFDSTMISPYPLLFFGGTIRYHEEGGQETVEVDHGIKFHCSIETAKFVMDLREALDKLLGEKIRDPDKEIIVSDKKEPSAADHILQGIIDLITNETVLAKRDSRYGGY